ncbi:MAG: M48 family metalloprotease [Burkholderiaceae bacterium]|nr:M48 family metalloprotease [Burkholderiaceae bacterium]
MTHIPSTACDPHAAMRPAAVVRDASRPLLQRVMVGLLGVSLFGSVVSPAAQAQVNLPALGDTASEDFNIGTERHLGDAIMRDIRRDPDYLDDPILLEYLQSLWQPLLAAARLRGDLGEELSQRFAYQPFLVRDRSVNAFALPGGYMGVHLGLMAITQTRDELASVMAHEMTHINQRHIARGFANSKRQSLISAAAMIIGVLAATRSGGGDAANAMIAGGQAVGIQGQLNFSRDMEREADRIGSQMMSSAGFEPAGMASMFERLQQSSRLNDNGGYPYLRSHPLTTERIGEARARLGTAGLTSTPPLVSSPSTALEHSAALARARVLMDTRVDSLRRWQGLDGEGRAAVNATLSERFADAYSSALASSLLRDWARADASMKKALDVAHGGSTAVASIADVAAAGALPQRDLRAERSVTLLRVESLLQRGEPVQAQAALAPLMRTVGPLAPDASTTSRPVMLLNARIALVPGRSQDDSPPLRSSADQLQTWVASYPDDAEAWSMLGRVSAQLGWALRSLRAEAESRYASGDLPGAIDRLKAGQRLARSGSSAVDFVESSVIDSRLRTIGAQRRQLLTEQLGYQ